MGTISEKLTQRVRAFGREQLELKSWYPIDTESQRKTEVEVDYFFFLPESLGVDKTTHPSSLFYQHRKIYLRFRAPSYCLGELYSGAQSKLDELKDWYQQYTQVPSKKSLLRFRRYCQFFGTIVHKSMRIHVTRIERIGRDDELVDAINSMLSHCSQLTTHYRDWLNSIGDKPENDEDPLIHLWYLDEYISLTIERYCFYVMSLFQKLSYRAGRVCQPGILEITAAESTHRRELGYKSVINEDSDNELYKYRYRALKRFFEQFFFMDVEQKKDSVVQEQILFVVAAGLAMAFATTIAIVAQLKLSIVSASFFWVMVITYMFKDRIKDIAKSRLKKMFLGNAFDHSFHLFSDFGSGQFAVVKESFAFLNANKLDATVSTIRGRPSFNLIADGGNPERVIRYRKKVRVYSKAFKKVYDRYDIKGVTDISRLNIERFVTNITPTRDVVYVSHGDHYSEAAAHKVYHMNVVVRQRGDVYERWSRYRVILDDSGVKRIEVVKTERKQKREKNYRSSND